MFWVALVVAVGAALCFAAVALAATHPRRTWLMPLGLFLLTASWVAASVWQRTSGRVSIK